MSRRAALQILDAAGSQTLGLPINMDYAHESDPARKGIEI
jgi:hypothetical protein